MKYLSGILVAFAFIACSDILKEDSISVLNNEKAVSVHASPSPWENGLVDHSIDNVTYPFPPKQIYFDTLQQYNYSDNISIYATKHFRLKNTGEPMATIQSNINAIDGIFVGIVRPNATTVILPDEELIIALSVIERVWESPGCQTEKVKFYGNAKIKYFFKCTNRDNGTWVRIPTNDPLITKFNTNKRGYFIGKNNLRDYIFYLNPSSMYFYIGYIGSYGNSQEIPQLVAVDKPYFTTNPVKSSGTGGSFSPINPRYLSTIGGRGVPHCPNLTSGHWNIRPCPNNCPE